MEEKDAQHVWVPKTEIDPYVLITEQMLKPEDQEKLEGDEARKNRVGVGTPQEVVGHYALETLAPSRTITNDQIGPKLPDGALANRRVTSVEVAADGMVLAIRRGAFVTLLLAPEDASKEPLVLPSTLVLDWRVRKGEGTTVFVAIETESIREFAQHAGVGKAIIAR